jgi:hypothetical protein
MGKPSDKIILVFARMADEYVPLGGLSDHVLPLPSVDFSNLPERPPPRLGNLDVRDLDPASSGDNALGLRSCEPEPISTASRLLLSNGVHTRHERSIRDSLLKMPITAVSVLGIRDRQHVTLGRPEFDNVSAVASGRRS